MEINRKIMKKTNRRQFQKMVELMERNPTIATGVGKFGSTKTSNKEAWASFAIELNALGPPLREGKEWHKVWLDFRLKTKKKLTAIRNEAIETGGVPYRQVSLSPMEEAVDALLNLTHAVAPSGKTFGGNTVAENASVSATMSQDYSEAIVFKEEEDSVSDENTPPVRRTDSQGAHDRDVEPLDILKKQTDTQMEFLQKIKNLEGDLHKIARYTRKIHELKSEKLALLKAKEEQKQRASLEASRRHKQIIELKLQLLEIENLKYGGVLKH